MDKIRKRLIYLVPFILHAIKMVKIKKDYWKSVRITKNDLKLLKFIKEQTDLPQSKILGDYVFHLAMLIGYLNSECVLKFESDMKSRTLIVKIEPKINVKLEFPLEGLSIVKEVKGEI